MSFGARLKAARNSKGLTQEQLAEAVGMTRASVCAYENGRQKSPSLRTLRKLADVLEVDVSSLVP